MNTGFRLTPAIFDRVLAVGGALMILLGAGYIVADPTPPDASSARYQFVAILLGLVVNQIGVWRLGGRLLWARRVHRKLRSELEHFLALARELNAHSLAGDEVRVENTKSALHESLERIEAVAGVRDEVA